VCTYQALYKKKYEEVIAKRSVSESDEAELRRIQRVLCIPNTDIFQVNLALLLALL
jgi:hypothetical protein